MAEMNIAKEFATQRLNSRGIGKVQAIRADFTIMLNTLKSICGTTSRELSIATTKLEEASFFAIKAVCLDPKNQSEEASNG